jgi:alkylation response protein AidB-like acyl-CoA dehydrogenase
MLALLIGNLPARSPQMGVRRNAAAAEGIVMSDFSLDLNEDQLQIQKWVHDFARDVIRPAGPEWDEREETPWPIIEEAARIGLYSWEFVASAFSDTTGLTLALVSEELCWGDAGITLSILGTSLGVSGILGSGTPEQIAEWVPQCFGTPDAIQMAAFAVSEPDAGSDVSSLRTRAVYDEAKDEWVINGAKTWITNGGITKVPTMHVVVAAVDPALKSRGHASFVVPPGTPGVSMGQKFKKMGIRASHTAEVVFDDVRIPGANLLGGKEKLDARLARAREGKSSRVQAAMSTFEASRPLVGAQAIGIARAAYEYALDYAKERQAFGRPIIMNQAIAFKLADMKMHIDAARLLVWRACWMAATGKQFQAGEGSMSKLYAGETAVRVTEDAIQVLGGAGYVREHPVEQWHRDSKIYTIFEGTSEIQRLVVARSISGLHIP